MATERIPKKLAVTLASGGPGQSEAAAQPIPLGPQGLLTVQCVIDNGTTGVAPTTSPLGSLRLYMSAGDGMPFSLVPGASADLDALSPIGDNALIGAGKSFECTPGYAIKIAYLRTSGGATDRIQLGVTVS